MMMTYTMEQILESNELVKTVKNYSAQIRRLYSDKVIQVRGMTQGMEHFDVSADKKKVWTDPLLGGWYEACKTLEKYGLVSESGEVAFSHNSRNYSIKFPLTEFGRTSETALLGMIPE
jgi:hypothetical protein